MAFIGRDVLDPMALLWSVSHHQSTDMLLAPTAYTAPDALDQMALLASVNNPEAAALIRGLQEITDNDRINSPSASAR